MQVGYKKELEGKNKSLLLFTFYKFWLQQVQFAF